MTTESHELPTTDLADGRTMPLVGLGTARLLGEECARTVSWSLQHGYRLLDTATMYSNEDRVGEGMSASGVPREQIFLTTKVPPERAGRERQTLEDSLSALGSDYVDLWLIHAPPDEQGGVSTWRELVRAREDGLARSIGVSNYSTAQIDTLTEQSGVTPAVNQIRWSPLLYDADVLRGHRDRGVVLEGYSPFRGGSLDAPAVLEVAERHGVTPAQVVVRWHVQHGVVVIPKSAHTERLATNADIGGLTLSDEEMAALDALGQRS